MTSVLKDEQRARVERELGIAWGNGGNAAALDVAERAVLEALASRGDGMLSARDAATAFTDEQHEFVTDEDGRVDDAREDLICDMTAMLEAREVALTARLATESVRRNRSRVVGLEERLALAQGREEAAEREVGKLRVSVGDAIAAGRYDVLKFLRDQAALVPLGAHDERRGSSVFNWHADAVARVEHWLSAIATRDRALATPPVPEKREE